MSIHQRVFNQLRDLRILEYFIKSETFRDAERLATDEQRDLMASLLESILRGPDELRTKLLSDLKSLCERIGNRDTTLVELRAKASMLCIRYYSRLTREQLIEAINNRLYHDSRNLRCDNGNQGHASGSGVNTGQHSVHQSQTGEGISGRTQENIRVVEGISGQPSGGVEENTGHAPGI